MALKNSIHKASQRFASLSADDHTSLNTFPWVLIAHSFQARSTRAPTSALEQKKGGFSGCLFEAFLTLCDPPRPGPAHPHEHGDSAAPQSLDPKQYRVGFRVSGSGFRAAGLSFRVEGWVEGLGRKVYGLGFSRFWVFSSRFKVRFGLDRIRHLLLTPVEPRGPKQKAKGAPTGGHPFQAKAKRGGGLGA